MNKKTIWQLLLDEQNEFPHRKCSNVTDEQIFEAEEALNLKFSQSYKFFLKNYEASAVGELDIFTITKSEHSSSWKWSIIDRTKHYKEHEKWPDINDWYIVSDNGSGDPIGINPKGEIWISYHNSGFEQEKLADDFEEFLYKLLTETLWE